MTKPHFNMKHDVAIVNNGGFFCHACLVGKPDKERSLDHRYCNGCYDFLVEEVKIDGSRRNMDWKPVVTSKDSSQDWQELRSIYPTVNRAYKKEPSDLSEGS